MVEHHVANVMVVGSSPIARSIFLYRSALSANPRTHRTYRTYRESRELPVRNETNVLGSQDILQTQEECRSHPPIFSNVPRCPTCQTGPTCQTMFRNMIPECCLPEDEKTPPEAGGVQVYYPYSGQIRMLIQAERP